MQAAYQTANCRRILQGSRSSLMSRLTSLCRLKKSQKCVRVSKRSWRTITWSVKAKSIWRCTVQSCALIRIRASLQIRVEQQTNSTYRMTWPGLKKHAWLIASIRVSGTLPMLIQYTPYLQQIKKHKRRYSSNIRWKMKNKKPAHRIKIAWKQRWCKWKLFKRIKNYEKIYQKLWILLEIGHSIRDLK